MYTNADSIEIDISDNEINENDEYLELNNQKIYKIYGIKIKDFKIKNEIKLSEDGNYILYRPKNDEYYFDSDSDSASDFEKSDQPKNFKKVNLNLYNPPHNLRTMFDYLDETVPLEKISKVKDPWLLDNEFNQDGFDSFIRWFKFDAENREIADALRTMISTVKYELVKFESSYLQREIISNFHLYRLENLNRKFTLDKFIYEQKLLSNKIRDLYGNEISKNLYHKISDEKWWILQSKSYNEKKTCIKCCPNKNYLCIFHIPYYFFFVCSILFSLSLQLFDLGSDIYVLIDLYNQEIYYFYCCLSILILTSFVNSILSMFMSSNKRTKPAEKLYEARYHGPLSDKNMLDIFINFILGLTQLSIFKEVYYSVKNEGKTHSFIWGRLLEGILESAPQSLFQLFIILKTYQSKSIMDISRYYLSICLSVINLAICLVSFEVYKYKTLYTLDRIFHIEELSYLSPYVIVLLFFRLFEISSRLIFVGLLSYITQNGFTIIFFLITDLIISGYLQYLLDFLPINKNYKSGIYLEHVKNIKDKTSCNIIICLFEIILYFPFLKLGNLVALWIPVIEQRLEDQKKYNTYHYSIKFITDLFCIGMIIYKFIEGNYNVTFLVLSIISLSGFIIKNILLFLLQKWIPNREENRKDYRYLYKFKPINLGCCNNCFKNCCSAKQKTK